MGSIAVMLLISCDRCGAKVDKDSLVGRGAYVLNESTRCGRPYRAGTLFRRETGHVASEGGGARTSHLFRMSWAGHSAASSRELSLRRRRTCSQYDVRHVVNNGRATSTYIRDGEDRPMLMMNVFQ